jgi:hypothetical protein
MNLAIDETCNIVQSDGAVVKRTVANIVVVDNLFDEPSRVELLDFITAPHLPHSLGVPEDKWERSTGTHAPPTWGLTDDVRHRLLLDANLAAVLEISSRLQRLYPEYVIGFVPDKRYFARPSNAHSEPGCDAIVGIAATYGDDFQWHADADPMSFPSCEWTRHFGHYCNHTPGKPLFVSLLLFLDRTWPPHMNAETLFLDPDSDCGVFIRPRAYRAVLMDQDVQHRFSTPAPVAGARAQYSLVWKLVFVPRAADTVVTLARPEWGRPCMFGSTSGAPPVLAAKAVAAGASRRGIHSDASSSIKRRVSHQREHRAAKRARQRDDVRKVNAALPSSARLGDSTADGVTPSASHSQAAFTTANVAAHTAATASGISASTKMRCSSCKKIGHTRRSVLCEMNAPS